MYLGMSSATVEIGALRVKHIFFITTGPDHCLFFTFSLSVVIVFFSDRIR